MNSPSFVREPVNPAVRMVRGWKRFWFTPADPTLLGLIRICCGLITLYVHLAYTGDLPQFFGRDAWCDTPTMNNIRENYRWPTQPWDWHSVEQELRPAKRQYQVDPPTDGQMDYMKTWRVNPEQKDYTIFRGYYSFSFWYHISHKGVSPVWMWIFHGATCFIILLFTIGFCTRLTAILTWLVTISYIHRAATALFGQDTMMNIVLLYLMIGPSGAALSVDRLIRRWWDVRRARKAGKPIPEWTPPRPLVSANIALRLIQVNLCLIYGMSGMSKLHGTSWWNGKAIWIAQANFEFAPMWFGPYVAWLRFLCDHRLLWELVISSSILFTFFVEVGFPFLVWNRTMRPYMIAGAVIMHTGIALTMGLRTFSMMMIVMDMAFLPQLGVRDLARYWLARARHVNGDDRRVSASLSSP
jgi:hypothetical protein